MILQMLIRTTIFILLLALFLPNAIWATLSFIIVFIFGVITPFMADQQIDFLVGYLLTPFGGFAVNWNLYVRALYKLDDGAFSALWQDNNEFYHMSWFGSMFLTSLNLFTQFLVLSYLSEVWPFQNGAVRPFYFIFSRQFWSLKKATKFVEKPLNAFDGSRFESTQLDPIVKIRNLDKGFYGSAPKFNWIPVIKDL
jgi:hypothetical protein